MSIDTAMDWIDWTEQYSKAGSLGFIIAAEEEICHHLNSQATLADSQAGMYSEDSMEHRIRREAFHRLAHTLREQSSEIAHIRQQRIRVAARLAKELPDVQTGEVPEDKWWAMGAHNPVCPTCHTELVRDDIPSGMCCYVHGRFFAPHTKLEETNL